MEKPTVCKYCGNEELTFHDSLEIFNPETSVYENIKEVHECPNCNAVYFQQDGNNCMQFDAHVVKSNQLNIGESK